MGQDDTGPPGARGLAGARRGNAVSCPRANSRGPSRRGEVRGCREGRRARTAARAPRGDGGAAAPSPDAPRGVPAGGLGRVQCVVAHASLAADPSFPFAQFQTVVDYEPQELSPHPLPPSLPPALKAAFSHNRTRYFQLRRVWPGGNPVRDALRAGALPSAWGTALQGLLGPGTPSVDRIVPYRLLHDLYTRSGDATLLGEGWC